VSGAITSVAVGRNSTRHTLMQMKQEQQPIMQQPTQDHQI